MCELYTAHRNTKWASCSCAQSYSERAHTHTPNERHLCMRAACINRTAWAQKCVYTQLIHCTPLQHEWRAPKRTITNTLMRNGQPIQANRAAAQLERRWQVNDRTCVLIKRVGIHEQCVCVYVCVLLFLLSVHSEWHTCFSWITCYGGIHELLLKCFKHVVGHERDEIARYRHLACPDDIFEWNYEPISICFVTIVTARARMWRRRYGKRNGMRGCWLFALHIVAWSIN